MAVATAVLFGAVAVHAVPWIVHRIGGDARTPSWAAGTPREVTTSFFEALGTEPDRVAALLAVDDPACMTGGDPENAEPISQMMRGVALSDLDIVREATAADGESVSVSGQLRIDRGPPTGFRLVLIAEWSGVGVASWRVCDFAID